MYYIMYSPLSFLKHTHIHAQCVAVCQVSRNSHLTSIHTKLGYYLQPIEVSKHTGLI